MTTLPRLSSGTLHTPSNARLASLQTLFPEVIEKSISEEDNEMAANRMHGRQTESGESSCKIYDSNARQHSQHR